MPLTKTYQGTDSTDYSDPLAWAKNSLRNAAYAWTASGSGTSEYYVRTAANGNPGIVATPATTNGIYVNGTAATKGTLGSLAAGNWGYGDNDALGYSTVYYRSAGVDPDTLADDYIQLRQIPQAGENVRIPAGAGSIVTGLDQNGVAILGFYVEEGYSGTIGGSTGYLLIDPDVFEVNSSGQSWIDVFSANIACVVINTGTGDAGTFGLNLRGSNIATVDVRGGSLGIAPLPGETSTVSTLKIAGENTFVKVGPGVTLSQVSPMFTGNLHLFCGATTVTKYGGVVHLYEAAAITTVNDLGRGEFHWGSSGNITTYNAKGGGWFNMRAGSAARTLTTLNLYTTSGRVTYNREAVTITTETKNDSVDANYSA